MSGNIQTLASTQIASGGGNGLLTNLISYWKLDEASGNAADAHGSNTLTDNNTVTSDTGLTYALARQFTYANDEYLSCASNASLQTGDIDFTFIGQMRLSDITTDSHALCEKWAGGNEYIIRFSLSDNAFQFIVNDGGGNVSVLASTFGVPSINTWYIIAAWHDATANTINIQINNGAVDSTSHTTGVATGAADFVVGGRGTGADDMDGRIGPNVFWKRVLDSTARTAVYNSGTLLPYASFTA